MNPTKPNKVAVIAAASLFLISSLASAQGPNPNVGKEAPELKVAEWATSKSITQEELAKAPYVLEFWATWCGPCRRTIPHLNELSQRVEPFGMKFLGLSREPIAKVKPFTKEMGMVYYVGAGHQTKGLEFRGIPFAAIIGTDGKVVWAGHPGSPKFEEKVWEVAGSYVDEDMKPLLEAAKTGALGPLYKSLAEIESEKAEAARKMIESNLALGVELSESTTGLKKLESLKAVAELYEGVPGGEAVKTRMADFRKDNPELQKEIKQKEILDELQAELRKIQAEAMKVRADKSPEAANAFYQDALLPVLEKFAAEHPDHPETAQIKEAVDQLKKKAEEKETQAGQDAEEQAGEAKDND